MLSYRTSCTTKWCICPAKYCAPFSTHDFLYVKFCLEFSHSIAKFNEYTSVMKKLKNLSNK